MGAVIEYKDVCNNPTHLRIMSQWSRRNVRNLLVYLDHRQYVAEQHQIAVVDSDIYDDAFWGFLVLPNSREPVAERPLKPWQIYPYYPLQLEHPDVIADPVAGHVVYSHPITVRKELLVRCLADFTPKVATKISGKVFHWLSTESPGLIIDDWSNQCIGGVSLDEMQMAHIRKMYG